MTWLLPELELGAEPELRPEELFELLEPEFELDPELVEPELVEPELVEPELVEPDELEPEEAEPVELEPELVDVEALAVWVDPGRTRANAPAAATLATVTAVVVDLTLDRPRSLAATAWRIPSSRRASLMSSIVPSCFAESLHDSSGPAMSLAGPPRPSAAETTQAT